MKVIPFKQKRKSIFADWESFSAFVGRVQLSAEKENRKGIRRTRCCCLTAHFAFSSILRIRIFCFVFISSIISIISIISITISISIIIGFLKNRSVFSQSKVLLQKNAAAKAPEHIRLRRSSIFILIRILILILICIAFWAFSKKGVVF